jgi:MFS family permease
VLLFACSLAMITYLDRVCFSTVAPTLQNELGLTDLQIGWLFTAFAFAYSVFEVPSGWMGDVYGPRRTLIRIVLWWSVFTVLTGVVTRDLFGPSMAFALLLVVRFLFGMGEAGAFPNIARAIHNWFPASERGFAQGAVWMSGRFAGGITHLLASALIWKVTAADGSTVTHWRQIFFIFGALGVIWVVVFALWFRDRPEEHPSVGAEELSFIRAGRPAEAGHHEGVPWGRLLTSGNLWALCALYFCCSYGWYFNITYLPKYLNSQYHVNAETYGKVVFGLMAGAPLLLGACACLLGGMLTDGFVRRTGDLRWGRRLFGLIGHGTCAVCYFLCLFAPGPYWFVAAVAMAAFFNDLSMGAAWAGCLDIGDRYSGIVSGCMNTIGNLGGAAAGVMTGLILDTWPGTTDFHLGWTINFSLFSAIYLGAVVSWLLFDASKPILVEK